MTTGSQLLLEVLSDAGIKYIFGNPGTTEMPIMHALRQFPEIEYILGLQETSVVAMADGYAKASGRPAFWATLWELFFIRKLLRRLCWSRWVNRTPGTVLVTRFFTVTCLG